MSDQLDIIFPKTKTLTLAGEEIEIKPFTFGQLPHVMKAIKTLMIPAQAALSQGKDPDLSLAVEVFAEGGEELISIMARCIGKPNDFINNLSQDEGIALLMAFFEVNADFFIKKVLPQLKSLTYKNQPVGLK